MPPFLLKQVTIHHSVAAVADAWTGKAVILVPTPKASAAKVEIMLIFICLFP